MPSALASVVPTGGLDCDQRALNELLGEFGIAFSDEVVRGDRLVLRFRNPTGGSLTLRAVAQLSP